MQPKSIKGDVRQSLYICKDWGGYILIVDDGHDWDGAVLEELCASSYGLDTDVVPICYL